MRHKLHQERKAAHGGGFLEGGIRQKDTEDVDISFFFDMTVFFEMLTSCTLKRGLLSRWCALTLGFQ